MVSSWLDGHVVLRRHAGARLVRVARVRRHARRDLGRLGLLLLGLALARLAAALGLLVRLHLLLLLARHRRHRAHAHEAHPLVKGHRVVGGLGHDVAVGRLFRLEAVDDELQQPAAAAQRAEQRELGHARPHDSLAVGVARVDLRHEISRDAALAVDLHALDVVVRGLAIAEVEHAGGRVQRVPPEVAVPRREGRHGDEPESQGRRGG